MGADGRHAASPADFLDSGLAIRVETHRLGTESLCQPYKVLDFCRQGLRDFSNVR